MKTYKLLIAIPLFLTIFSCKQETKQKSSIAYAKYYDEYNVTGSFALYNLNADSLLITDQVQFETPYTPVSTFKILNSLIALETEAIPDKNFVIKWDGHVYDNPEWNKDQDMVTAFKNSTVWYYQEVARRVGAEQMKKWLVDVKYGNADIGGGIDKFWISGDLRITPHEQIKFLKRLYKEKLPFKKKKLAAVKKMMITKETPDYTIRSKTGWGVQNGTNIGWYIGYIETTDNVYFFVNCIQTKDNNNKDFANARIAITNKIITDLKIITNFSEK